MVAPPLCDNGYHFHVRFYLGKFPRCDPGQHEPIIVLDGMVLDGWHRYQACDQLGLKAKQFTFGADEDPVAWVLSHNLHRRHLTASQRAAAVVACAAWVPSNIGRPRVEMVSTLAQTNAEMAKAAGTTVRTVTDAKAAHKAGLGDAVKQGAMTANEAAAVARGKPAKPPAPKAEPPAPPPADDGPDAAELAAAERKASERSPITVEQPAKPPLPSVNAC